MDALEPTQPASPPEPTAAVPPARKRLLSRRALFKFAGGVAAVGLGAEVVRVVFLANKHTVIPGRVYRTAQLTPKELQEFVAEKGIRTVINLRGVCSNMPWYLDECRVTHAANVNQEDVTFSAKRFPAPGEVQRLIEVFDHTAYPVVMHCQRGADRTGVAATIARLLLTNDDLPTARRQMWPRYGHLAVGRTAVLDVFFDYYEAWLAARGETHAPDRFRRWANTDYCPGPYRARLSLLGGTTYPAGRGFTFTVRAVNTSVEPWRFTTGATGGFCLQHTLTTAVGVTMQSDRVGNVVRIVNPGEFIDFTCGVPPLPTGRYALHADLVDAEPIEGLNTAFFQYGSAPLQTAVVIS